MKPGIVPRFAVLLVVLLLGTAPARAEPATPASGDEDAIRAVDKAFRREYDQGDSKALAALFADDAEVVEEDGARHRGRDRIERELAAAFKASPGATIAFEVESIRWLSPEVAEQDGRSVVTPRDGAPVAHLETVLYVRRDGHWLIAGVREAPDPLVRPHDRLKGLEWMVGEWLDEGTDAVARFDCRWSEDGNFLLRSFTLRRAGKAVLSGTQRIGWDALARQVRSWEFDSEGGFGEGRWTRDGARWVIKHTAVRPEGAAVSATNVMTRVRPDLMRWVSTDRVVGDRSLPDDSFVLVRVPPAPRLGSHAPATPSPKIERNPR